MACSKELHPPDPSDHPSTIAESECKIFVGNLSVTVKQHKLLQDFFSKFGDVERAQIIFNRATGQSKKIGFVTFSNPNAASRALQASNEELFFYERVLRVHRAEEKRSIRMINKATESLQINPAEPCVEKKDVTHNVEPLVFLLNMDCVFEIFRFLNIRQRLQFEMVCTRWYELSQQCWKMLRHISFEGVVTRAFSGINDEDVLLILKRISTPCVSIDLSTCRTITDALPAMICKFVPQLECLNLSNNAAIFTPMVAEILGKEAPNLKQLYLCNPRAVTHKGLVSLFKYATKLEVLDLSGVTCHLQALAFVPSLRGLRLDGCAAFDAELLQKLLSRCQYSLEWLDLNGLRYIASLDITMPMPNLKRIGAAHWTSIGVGNLYNVIAPQQVPMDLSGAINLESLNLCHSTQLVCETHLKKLSQTPAGKHLRHLDLSRTMNNDSLYEDIPTLLSYVCELPNLETLDISYSCLGVPAQFQLLLTNNKLKCLKMIGIAETVVPSSLIALLELPALEQLDMSGYKPEETYCQPEVIKTITEAMQRRFDGNDSNMRKFKLIAGGSSLLPLIASKLADKGASIDRTNNCSEWLRPVRSEEVEEDQDDEVHIIDDAMGLHYYDIASSDDLDMLGDYWSDNYDYSD